MWEKRSLKKCKWSSIEEIITEVKMKKIKCKLEKVADWKKPTSIKMMKREKFFLLNWRIWSKQK